MAMNRTAVDGMSYHVRGAGRDQRDNDIFRAGQPALEEWPERKNKLQKTLHAADPFASLMPKNDCQS